MRTWVALALVLPAIILLSSHPVSATTIVVSESSGTCNHVVGCTVDLPFSPVTGQVILLEPEFFNLPGDIITFDSTTDTAVFASDDFNGFLDPADTSSSPSLLTNLIYLTEPSVISGPETFLYSPYSGEPGYGLDGAGEPISYRITSDSGAVPEPSSLLLLGAGLICLLWMRRWVDSHVSESRHSQTPDQLAA